MAGAVERKGLAVARVVENVRADTLPRFVRKTVSPNVDMVVTDKWVGYKHLGKEFPHEIVDHSAGEYVSDGAHTDTIEGYWSQLKRFWCPPLGLWKAPTPPYRGKRMAL